MLRFSKHKFFSTQVSSLRSQSNKLWKTLKRSDTQSPSDITLLGFNKFYTPVGVNLTRDLPFVQNIELPFEIKSSFSLQSISWEFVLKKLL